MRRSNKHWARRLTRLNKIVWLVAAIPAAALMLCLGFVIAVEHGCFRSSVIRFVAARAGRPIVIAGALQVRLLSFLPHVTAERVTIGNPPWVPAGTTAEVERLFLRVKLPAAGRPLSIDRLELRGANLHLFRDADGRANWQLTDPNQGPNAPLPVIHSLEMPRARVVLDDQRRHLQYDGVVSATDAAVSTGLPVLRMDGTGQLNGKTDLFHIEGDPLISADLANPYHFTFDERSSVTLLSGRGFLLRPFDFDALDTTFDAAGADLKDLYYLTGVTLVHSGDYHLTGMLSRRGSITQFRYLEATSGVSDLRGQMTIDSTGKRARMTAELKSKFVRMADIGAGAAGRGPDSHIPALMLSDAAIEPAALRRIDVLARIRAERVQVGRQVLRSVSAKLTIDGGVARVTPLVGDLWGGKLTARIQFDARTDAPVASADMTLADAQLAELDHKGDQPPLSGLVRARVILKGKGKSIHQVAADADGTLTAVLPHGTIRASLAELMGMDLRGLGLLLDKSRPETSVRCAIASFQARQGTFTAQSLLLDTEPVLVSGEGTIRMDSEELDLKVRGHPKHVRLVRLKSPITIRGTLTHPAIGVQAASSAAQVAEAVALGVVLSPLAAILAFVDPGLAKDADCAAVMGEAKARGD